MGPRPLSRLRSPGSASSSLLLAAMTHAGTAASRMRLLLSITSAIGRNPQTCTPDPSLPKARRDRDRQCRGCTCRTPARCAGNLGPMPPGAAGCDCSALRHVAPEGDIARLLRHAVGAAAQERDKRHRPAPVSPDNIAATRSVEIASNPLISPTHCFRANQRLLATRTEFCDFAPAPLARSSRSWYHRSCRTTPPRFAAGQRDDLAGPCAGIRHAERNILRKPGHVSSKGFTLNPEHAGETLLRFKVFAGDQANGNDSEFGKRLR